MRSNIAGEFIYMFVLFSIGIVLTMSSKDNEVRKTNNNSTANTTTNHQIYVLTIRGNTFKRPKKVATINTITTICDTSIVNIARVIVLGKPYIVINEVRSEAISFMSTKTLAKIAVV